jgi:hypothetical protein
MSAADAKSVKEMNRAERRALARHLEDVKATWGTPAGRRVLWQIMADAGFTRTSMTGNSWTFFNEGARNIALAIYDDAMEACPELFLLALQEAKNAKPLDPDLEPESGDDPEKEEDNG